MTYHIFKEKRKRQKPTALPFHTQFDANVSTSKVNQRPELRLIDDKECHQLNFEANTPTRLFRAPIISRERNTH